MIKSLVNVYRRTCKETHFLDTQIKNLTNPWLGKTATSETASAYIQILSRGGLKMPSLRFQQYLDKFEERFRALHEDKIYPYEDPIGTLSTLLNVEFPEIPLDIVNLFSKTRFFIRLKKLNGDLKVLKKKYKKQYQNHVNKF